MAIFIYQTKCLVSCVTKTGDGRFNQRLYVKKTYEHTGMDFRDYPKNDN